MKGLYKNTSFIWKDAII